MGRLTVIVGGAAELDQARLELARSDRGYSTRFVPVDGLAERFAGWFRTDVLPDNLSIAVKEALEAIAPPFDLATWQPSATCRASDKASSPRCAVRGAYTSTAQPTRLGTRASVRGHILRRRLSPDCHVAQRARPISWRPPRLGSGTHR
jgi:hypothetical protein